MVAQRRDGTRWLRELDDDELFLRLDKSGIYFQLDPSHRYSVSAVGAFLWIVFGVNTFSLFSSYSGSDASLSTSLLSGVSDGHRHIYTRYEMQF